MPPSTQTGTGFRATLSTARRHLTVGKYEDRTANHIQRRSYGPLVWVPNLDPNPSRIYTMHQLGAHRTDPTRLKKAHNKGCTTASHTGSEKIVSVCTRAWTKQNPATGSRQMQNSCFPEPRTKIYDPFCCELCRLYIS